QAFGGVAGEHFAGGRDVEELPSPATHACFRAPGVIVGHHIVYGENALEPGARLLDRRSGTLELLRGRQQGTPVGERPAVILDMRDFEALGTKCEREVD